MIIEGFEPKEVRSKKLDIQKWISKDSKDKVIFQKVEAIGGYTAACDTIKAVVLGDIDSFLYQTFPDDSLLRLLQKVLPEKIKNSSTLEIDFKQFYDVIKLLKDKQNKNCLQPLLMRFYYDKINMSYINTDMFASMQAKFNDKTNIKHISFNATSMFDALTFLKNRKHTETLTLHFDTSVTPISIFAKDIYIFMLPLPTTSL